MRFRSRISIVPAALALLLVTRPASAVTPFNSFDRLVTGNGHIVAQFNRTTRRLDNYWEAVYRFWDMNTQTRDFAFDSYFGLRVTRGGQTANAWLTDVAIDDVAYVAGSNIIRVKQTFSGVSVTQYLWSPFAVDAPALVTAIEIENTGAAADRIDVFSLANFHLGSGRPEPGADGEHVTWDGRAYREAGAGGAAMVFLPSPLPTHYGVSPDNPFGVLTSGGDLQDGGDSGVISDAVHGFQWQFDAVATGAKRSAVIAMGHHVFADTGALQQSLDSYLGSLDLAALVAREQAEWAAWLTAPPAGLPTAEHDLWRQAQVVLRMGQVRQSGTPFGQIVASMPPGMWNIAWVRDMAYAIAGLAVSGHPQEAWDGLAFMLGATVGDYQTEVGFPYAISVTRYFGNGVEESDFNEHGPNIEFDGFGLFLWALEVTVNADTSLPWQAHWPKIRDLIADVLIKLQDLETGLIAPDSSIWEVHWQGQQKRFSYTSLAAARGLCSAVQFAAAMGDDTNAQVYLQASQRIRDSLVKHVVDSQGVLAQSFEDLLRGSGYYDAAVVEAINWGLFDPSGVVAGATLDMLLSELRPPSGEGFFRNDDGGWYDLQEWVFIDARAALAFALVGRQQIAEQLSSWVVGQALENYGLFAELHDATTGAYAGEIPMVGFGAGTYLLLKHRQQNLAAAAPACGSWAQESSGADAGPGDGGSDAGIMPPSDDGCSVGGTGGWPLLILLMAWRCRRRSKAGGLNG